jgi:hypothetical protein
MSEREDIFSTETWEGGDGTVTFNYLQQHEDGFDDFTRELTPLEVAGTTDIWDIVEE